MEWTLQDHFPMELNAMLKRATRAVKSSRFCAGLSILISTVLFLPAVIGPPLIQSIIMSCILFVNILVSFLIFPAIDLKLPFLFLPKLVSSIVAIYLIACAVLELNGLETILRVYQSSPFWSAFGINVNIIFLVIASAYFIVGNFIVVIHFFAFKTLSKIVNKNRSIHSADYPPDRFNSIQTTRPANSPPTYEESVHHYV